MTSPEAKKAFDIRAEADALRDEYGRNTLGQSCLMARRLVQAGVRCVTVDHSNWDTHDGNFRVLKEQLLPKLDAALSTLFRDLADRGMLDSTLVIVTGEFGRTPRINKNAGRDHWGPAFTVALGGGGDQGRPRRRQDRRPRREAGRRPARPRRPGGHAVPPARHRPRSGFLYSRRPAGEDRQQRPRHPGVAVRQKRTTEAQRTQREETQRRSRCRMKKSSAGRFGSSLCVFSLCLCASVVQSAFAEPPVASYLFPAGGRRGTTVDVHVGGLFLHKDASWELLGPGVELATPHLEPTRTLWFEGPMLPLPESQAAEDYPKDTAARVRIAADAALGVRRGRVWTAQGAASGLAFVVGDLPEIVEQEIDGDPVPVDVQLPVTINGRIFPRQNVDVWTFPLHKGQTVACDVCAARIGSPLDSYLEVIGPDGRVVAENDDALGADSFVRFTAAADGKYGVRIRDANGRGGPAYVYRLTLTTDPYVDRVYPLGGRRGEATHFTLYGQGVPAAPVEVKLPADGPRDYAWRFPYGDGKATNPVLLDLDDLPEMLKAEPNERRHPCRRC